MQNSDSPAALLARYDRPGPRYTSYPTAVEFSDAFTPARYAEILDEAARHASEPLSLYVHLPFCQARCAFCGCNVIITDKTPVTLDYLSDVEREIALVSARLGARRSVVQLHWGGGTPTYYAPESLQRLWNTIAQHFTILGGAEIAVEVDPRVTSDAHVDTLIGLGFNRFSLGVQDFDERVQAAVGRHQTEEQTTALVASLRAHGVSSINFDLIYGLPQQTPESFRRTVERVIACRPERIACYSYAYVPWHKAHQTRIDPEDLPPADVKLALFAAASEMFLRAGYETIGMDHFALATDSLAVAAREHALYRNFMGYTTHPARDSIGFGVSAIGDIGGAFAQNTKKLNRYHDAIAAGAFPIERGFERSADDRIRGDVIREIMCNFYLDTRAIERAHGIDFAHYFARELEDLGGELTADGIVQRTDGAIEVTAPGRAVVRNVAMVFDAYLQKHDGARPVFSRTI